MFVPELILVGIVIRGRKKLDIIMSKKVNVSLRFEMFNKSKLKSPAINTFFFG